MCSCAVSAVCASNMLQWLSMCSRTYIISLCLHAFTCDCIWQVCGHDILQTACQIFTKFKALMQFGTKMKWLDLRSEGHDETKYGLKSTCEFWKWCSYVTMTDNFPVKGVPSAVHSQRLSRLIYDQFILAVTFWYFVPLPPTRGAFRSFVQLLTLGFPSIIIFLFSSPQCVPFVSFDCQSNEKLHVRHVCVTHIRACSFPQCKISRVSKSVVVWHHV